MNTFYRRKNGAAYFKMMDKDQEGVTPNGSNFNRNTFYEWWRQITVCFLPTHFLHVHKQDLATETQYSTEILRTHNETSKNSPLSRMQPTFVRIALLCHGATLFIMLHSIVNAAELVTNCPKQIRADRTRRSEIFLENSFWKKLKMIVIMKKVIKHWIS